MGGIVVYLENGFDHDRVTVSAGDVEHHEPEVTTRYQVGLASVVELEVTTPAPAVVRVALPDRGLAAEATLDPAATPHVRVDLSEGALAVRAEAAPPMFG